MTNKEFTLLIIDDDLDVLKLASESTTKWGIKTITAETVAEAMRLIPSASIILADVNIPNGRDLNQELTNVALTKPVARFSGDPNNRLVQNYYMGKPFTRKELKECIEHLISLYKALKG